MWRAFDSAGNLAYGDFVETVATIIPMWWARVVGGSLYFAGLGLLAVNYVMTWRTRPSVYEVPVIRAMPLTRTYVDPPAPPSRIQTGVLEVAKKLDVFQQLQWHRIWERKAFQFTVWVVAVLLASALEMIPTFLIRNVPTIAT
jgi:cytochrome c oxidase cbb3-type subunit I/II